jgi:ribosomal protein S12
MIERRVATLSLEPISGVRAVVQVELAKGLSKEFAFVCPTEEECREHARVLARQHGAILFESEERQALG